MADTLCPHPAYLAGLIDGEGCILIARFTDRGRPRNPTHRLHVVIVNNHEGVLRAIQADYGGQLKLRNNGVFALCVTDRRAEAMLNDAEPWMVIKREQVALAREFLATKSKVKHCKAGVPPEMIVERDRLKAAISTVNQRRGRAA